MLFHNNTIHKINDKPCPFFMSCGVSPSLNNNINFGYTFELQPTQDAAYVSTTSKGDQYIDPFDFGDYLRTLPSIDKDVFKLGGFSIDELRAMESADNLPDYSRNDKFRPVVTEIYGKDLKKIKIHAWFTSGLDGVAIHDGYIECLADIRVVFFGNYPPSTNLKRVKKRLLWLGYDGLPGEKCWRKMFVTLIDMYVHKYEWNYDVAKNFVMRTTVVINRTPVLMNGSIRKNNKPVYEKSVAFTDPLNKALIQEIIPQMTNKNLHLFMFGEPVYETLNDLLRSIASSNTNVSIPQIDKLAHMLRYNNNWSNYASKMNLYDGFNSACASTHGINPTTITSEDYDYLTRSQSRGWTMDELTLKELWDSDPQARRAFTTMGEFASYLAEDSIGNSSDRCLVWRMQEIKDAGIKLKWKQTKVDDVTIVQATVNDDVKRQLAKIPSLVKCTHKQTNNNNDHNSVQSQIGGSQLVIKYINTTSLTQLRKGKFVAIQISTNDKIWPYWPSIKTNQRGITLPYDHRGDNPRCARDGCESKVYQYNYNNKVYRSSYDLCTKHHFEHTKSIKNNRRRGGVKEVIRNGDDSDSDGPGRTMFRVSTNDKHRNVCGWYSSGKAAARATDCTSDSQVNDALRRPVTSRKGKGVVGPQGQFIVEKIEDCTESEGPTEFGQQEGKWKMKEHAIQQNE